MIKHDANNINTNLPNLYDLEKTLSLRGNIEDNV